ncbi:MAG: hypothetical protein FJ088_10955, partial [Deltaproteobacteria bacterium]|nr:hypothetical protein [Deltaproteobacteria bacterium]
MRSFFPSLLPLILIFSGVTLCKERKSPQAAGNPPLHETVLKEIKYGNFPFTRGDRLDPAVKAVMEKIRASRFGSKSTGSLENLSYESSGILDGMGFEAVTRWKAPDRLRIDYKSGLSVVYSAGSAFVVYSPVVLDVVIEEVERLKTAAWARHLSLSLQFDDPGLEVEMWGESEFQKRKAIKIRVWSEDLEKYALFYFDREGFSLLGLEYSAELDGGSVDFIEAFSDYRVVEGINLPHERSVRTIDGSLIGRTYLVEKISSLSFVAAGEEKFSKPPQAKNGAFYLREIPGMNAATIRFGWQEEKFGDKLLEWMDKKALKPYRAPVATNLIVMAVGHSVHPLILYFSPFSSLTIRFEKKDALEAAVAIGAADGP